jgi:hypothetical protein
MNPVKDEAFRQTPRAVSRLRFTPEKLLNLSMVGVAGFSPVSLAAMRVSFARNA